MEVGEMLLNFTNHHSSKWSQTQWEAAINQYETVKDFSFPNISPEYSKEEVVSLAREYVETIEEMKPDAVLCQGEFTFVYHVICLLKEKKIEVLAATSERCVNEVYDKEKDQIIKQTYFQFVQFRAY